MKFQKLTESELKKFIQGNYPELLEEERLINLLSGGSPGEILKFSSDELKIIEKSVFKSIEFIKKSPYFKILDESKKVTDISLSKMPFLTEDDINELSPDTGKSRKKSTQETREILLDWFSVMQIFLRDLYFHIRKYPGNFFYFQHLKSDFFSRVSSGIEAEALFKVIKEIENIRSALEKNANRELVFLNFVMEIKELFK
ncbi:MAG: hypothetical protein PHV06_10760 [bacterium]|nr:hypothetical protein [bacterium]